MFAIEPLGDPAFRRRGSQIGFGQSVTPFRAQGILFARGDVITSQRITMFDDMRITLRVLRKSGTFTAVTVAVFALVTAAVATVGALARGVWLAPLAYDRPEELVQLRLESSDRFGPFSSTLTPHAVVERWRDEGQEVRDVAVVRDASHDNVFYLTGRDAPERLEGAVVSTNFFDVLGVGATLGRTWEGRDERSDWRVAVLSHGLWARAFGAHPGVIGQRILLDDTPFVVLGVMPSSFTMAYPPDEGGHAVALWVPQPARGAPPPNVDRVIARLTPGSSARAAAAEVDRFLSDLGHHRTQAGAPIRARLIPLHEQLVGHTRDLMSALAIVVALALTIAAANIAGMQMARTASRRQEIAVRLALGAPLRRLLRQFVTEGMALGVMAGAVGLVLAMWTIDLAVALAPATLPRLDAVRIDGPVAFTAIIVTALAAVVSSTGPGFLFARAPDQPWMRVGRGVGGTPRGGTLWNALVVGQVALTMALLVSTMLMARSLTAVRSIDTGISTDGIVVADIYRPRHRQETDTMTTAFYSEVRNRVAGLPGVRSVAMASSVPFRPRDYYQPEWRLRIVSPDFFTTLGIAIVQGREFDERDHVSADPVAIVSEALARSALGNDAVGRSLDGYRIVGISRDIRHVSPDVAPHPVVYVPAAQRPDVRMSIVVRSAFADAGLAAAVRATVWDLDPDQPVAHVATLHEVLRATDAVTVRRLNATVLTGAAGLALVLAVIGVYGIVAHRVVARTREIGLRVALGAASGRIVSMVLGSGLRLASVATVFGLVGSVAMIRVLATFFFGLSTLDTLLAMAVVMSTGLVMGAACLPAAARAARIDPVRALTAD